MGDAKPHPKDLDRRAVLTAEAQASAGPEDDAAVLRVLSPETRPSWSDVTSAGVFRVEQDPRRVAASARSETGGR